MTTKGNDSLVREAAEPNQVPSVLLTQSDEEVLNQCGAMVIRAQRFLVASDISLPELID